MKKIKTAEEIFLDEVDESVAHNFSDCSSFVELIDGFGYFKLHEDKANYIRGLIINAIKQAQLDMLEYAVNKCAENAEAIEGWNTGYSGNAATIDKQSILKTIDEIKKELENGYEIKKS